MNNSYKLCDETVNDSDLENSTCKTDYPSDNSDLLFDTTVTTSPHTNSSNNGNHEPTSNLDETCTTNEIPMDDTLQNIMNQTSDVLNEPGCGDLIENPDERINVKGAVNLYAYVTEIYEEMKLYKEIC